MPVKRNDMTFEQVRRLFDYDPITGVLTWTSAAPHKRLVGTVAGSKWRNGYIIVLYRKKTYRAHRLIWVWMTGSPPAVDVDHEDLCRTNNAWKNLRAATRSQNAQNMGLTKRNTSGHKNVHWNKKYRRWRVRFRVDKQEVWVGFFETIDAAVAARDAAMAEYQPEFGRAA